MTRNENPVGNPSLKYEIEIPEGAEAFDAFSDLAGKLVRVPKSEIDAERAREQEARAR